MRGHQREKARNTLSFAIPGACLYLLSMPPIGWWWAAPLGLFLLFKSGLKNWGAWLLLGLLLHLALYFWIVNVSIPGWIALSLIAALFWSLPFYLYKKWPTRIGIAALWVSLEGLRSWLGWGWLPLAATTIGCPVLLNWARLGGEALVGFLLLFGVLTLVQAIESSPSKQKIILIREFFLFLILLVLVGMMLGNLPMESRGNIRLGFIQPNAPTKEQYTDSDYHALAVSLNRLSNNLPHPDLVLWPEEAPSWSPANNDPRLRVWLEDGARLRGAPLVSGLLWQEGDHYYNAVGIVHPRDGLTPIVYKKRRLVVFGEYIPFSQWGWARSLTPVVSSFSAGDRPVVLRVHIPATTVSLWPLICYEDIFNFLSEGAGKQCDVIGVFINDGWFGPGAMQQHAAHSVLRAVEQGIPVVRVSNSGLSGIMLPDGSSHSLAKDSELGEILNLPLERIDTPYVRMEPYWKWVFPIAVLIALGLSRKNKKSKTK